jgi:hypothetical protein
MTIYFDSMGHMVSDTSISELHGFAKVLGLRREWFQNKGKGRGWIPHYDLTTPNSRRRAKSAGATQVDSLEIVKILRSAPYKDDWEKHIGEGMT